MENVFITGIQGFIGSSLAKAIVEKRPDVNVVGLVRDYPSNKQARTLYDLTGKINLVQGDLLDRSLLERVITEYEIDTIFNFAALAIIRICEDAPFNALNVNVLGSGLVAELARNHKKVKHVIQFTSDKAYGSAEKLPYVEGVTPLKGTRPYETTKSLVDMWCQMYQVNYHTPISVIRGANVFGPGDPNYSRVVPQFCRSIARDQNPWLWEGVAGYKREFIYVDDVTDFLLYLVDKGKDNPALIPDCYNLGSGNVFTMKDFGERLIKVAGKNLEMVLKKKDFGFGEIEEQYLSLEKTKSRLGWTAKYVGPKFDEALLNTYHYYHKLVEVFERNNR